MQTEGISDEGRDDKVRQPAAGKGEPIARLTLNGRAIEFGGAQISEADLRANGRVPDDEVLIWERDGQDVDMLPGDTIALADGKTERVRSEKRLITVFYENKPREIRRGIYTTEELKTLFGVQDGYILEVINDEGQLTPLKPHAKLRVKEGMRFFEQVPCGGSS